MASPFCLTFSWASLHFLGGNYTLECSPYIRCNPAKDPSRKSLFQTQSVSMATKESKPADRYSPMQINMRSKKPQFVEETPFGFTTFPPLGTGLQTPLALLFADLNMKRTTFRVMTNHLIKKKKKKKKKHQEATQGKTLGVPSPFFPGILLSRKPPDTQGKWPVLEKKHG